MRFLLPCLFAALLSGCANDIFKPFDACADATDQSVDACQATITVSQNDCIIKQAIVKLGNGYDHSKYIYFYDGTHYYKIDVYDLLFDSTYADTANRTFLLNYDNNRIADVKFINHARPGNYIKTTYVFSNDKVFIRDFKVVNGTESVISEKAQYYEAIQHDTLFQFEEDSNQLVGEYKSGNRIRLAKSDNGGKCVINNKNWRFYEKAYFDQHENVMKDFAVRMAFEGGNGLPSLYQEFWLENNSNNLLAEAYDAGNGYQISKICWTFLVSPNNDFYLKKYVGNGGSVEYTYDCE
jgi:hypothetical protein